MMAATYPLDCPDLHARPQGGSVSIAGSEVSSAHSTDGGEGGNIVLIGGEGKGESKNDNGGSINLQGGNSFEGCGRSLSLLSPGHKRHIE